MGLAVFFGVEIFFFMFSAGFLKTKPPYASRLAY